MPRDPLGALGEARVGGSGPGFGWARARRAGVGIFWLYLGQKNAHHYYVSKDRVAAFTAPAPIEDAWDWNGSEEGRQLYTRIVDEVCALARAQPSAYVFLPRDAPPLLHLHTDGWLWLALDDWPKPQDIMRVGRLPYARARKHGAAMFHFQVLDVTIIIAQRAW
jgi:hypothetical protein